MLSAAALLISRRTFAFLAGAFALALVSATAGMAEPDLLIRNGRVYTGASADAPLVAADLAVTGDRITAVGPGLAGPAKRVIDATGLVVSPGFIDLHAHLESLLEDRAAESAVRQGVTLALGNPDGGGPVDLAAHFRKIAAGGVGPNVAFLTGHNSIRAQVMGMEQRAPTDAELASMRDLVTAAMRAGAFGLSTGLLYLPGTYADRAEVVALARVAAGFGGLYTSHLRKEGLGLLEGVDEAVLIAEEANIPVILTHHKAVGTSMRGASVQSLARVDAARARGLDVMLDQYPYTATFTSLRVLIPAWALAGDRTGTSANLARRLADPSERAKIESEIAHNLLHDRGGGDLSCVQFSRFAWKPALNGKTLRDWALAEGREPTIATGVDLVLQAELRGGASCIFHVLAEEDVLRIMRHPQTMIASDGRLSRPGQDHPHPRAYGTFPRVLGVYVREKQNLPLTAALYKMTAQPARRLGLSDRGVIRVGAFADLALFDPAVVADRSTFDAPHQYPVGLPYVIVNGRVALDPAGYHDIRAGRILRGPGTAP